MEAHPTDPNPQLLLSALTTEHFTLASGRSATISEAMGRGTMYFSALSGILVALGFVGQMSGMGQPFFVFAFVLFPSVLFLGVATYIREVQLGIEDMICSRGINRIRHFYLELAPEAEKYFILSTHDDIGSASLRHLGLVAPWWQMFMTAAGVVEVINGVVAGTLAGMALEQWSQISLLTSVGVGVVAFVVVVAAQHRYAFRLWDRVERHIVDVFPASADPPLP